MCIAFVTTVFNHFDDDGNGNGKISPKELRLCVGSMGGDLSEGEAEATVVLMDSYGDGELGFKDFVRLIEGGEEEEEEKVKELREAFRMYEMGDGCECITPKSLRKMLRKLGKSNTSIEECKVMIAQFDLDGD
ncbi:putative calcium-binding protein CML23 [Rhododendron vialii]|uniref:putative calcium-binding protein CML23 n=1 Tax=Rhododendron vialii TaxID=182163 RepID=UPI00265E82E3|nr:putative calcium-binding protein CML23 [Rhododendron vialii]